MRHAMRYPKSTSIIEGLSKFWRKKYLPLLPLCVVIFLCLNNRSYFWNNKHRTIKGLECYTLPQKDEDVFSVPGFTVKPNTIFFLETSCRHGSVINVTKRQACAYESAAKAHPDSEVLVLFPSPITLKNPTPVVTELLKYPNIKLVHVDMEKYFMRTPLEEFYLKNSIENSSWPMVHMSDVLRYLTLWKYGGTYLDSDVVMARPINTMENFAGAESEYYVANGILNFNISNSGRQIIEEMLMEVKDHFRGNKYVANGPDLITRVLRRICKEDDVLGMTPEKCSGFTVHPPSAFYPIPPKNWTVYFTGNVTQSLLDQLNESFGIHVWNKLSSGALVNIGSRMPYSIFASKFCPRIYSVAGSYL